MSSLSRPRRLPGLPLRELPDGGTVVLAPSGTALVLNATASIVVYLADGSRTVDEIADEIAGHATGVPRDQVAADVSRIVGELADAGLLDEACPQPRSAP